MIVLNVNRRFFFPQHGFTLVEVMLALLVFLVIMLGLAQGELAALRIHNENVLRDEALRLAEDEINRLKALQFSIQGTSPGLVASVPPNWSNLPDATVNIRGGNTIFARRLQINDLISNAVAMKRINVAVGWNQGNSATLLAPTGMNQQISLSTIIVQQN